MTVQPSMLAPRGGSREAAGDATRAQHTPARGLAAIVGAFLAGNIAWLAWSGVRMGGDSPLYMNAATLLEGGYLERFQIAHIGYISAVVLCQSTGIGLIGLVLIQIAVAGFAIVAVYRLGFALAGSIAGLVAAALLACDIETARWHAFILTDSFYLSILTISVWWVHRLLMDPVPGWNRPLAATGSLLLVASMRPEGLLVPPLAATYWAVGATIHRVRRVTGLALAFGAALLMLALVPPVRAALDGVLPVEPLPYGHTIWGYDRWTISMPGPDAAANRRGVASAVRYAAGHPAKTLELMLARVAVHFGHIRPFYSRGHNLAILVWLLPIYAFGVRGWQVVRSDPLAGWSVAVIAAHTAVVAVTHADWDGRYLAHVLPLIYVLSGCGVAAVAGRLAPRSRAR